MSRSEISLATLLSILSVLPCAAQLARDTQKIAAVTAGTITEARASWWGFDPEDSTANLQAAIDSRVPKLIVGKMSGPWVVTPVKLVSNQEIVFEEGVEVLAKRGEFKRIGDALFSARNCENVSLTGYGATWRMWREDYANPTLYEPAEWRHCLFLGGCSNVKVYGLRLAESGGDGIYLGSGKDRTPNRNVHIKDVTCERHYRQGISVINAENLLIESTVLRDTAGTPPCAGIDFEPNSPEERLVNCVMRDCEISNNAGNGIVLALRPMDAAAEDISLRFENCTSTGDHGSVRIDMNCNSLNAPDGTIEFIAASSHPLNLNGEGGPIRLISSTGDFYFWVPTGTREFGVRVGGQGEGEGVRALLINPDGKVVDEVDNSAATYQFEVDLAEGTPSQAWVLRIAKPTAMPMEDHHVDLRGIPPLLAPSAEALLVPVESLGGVHQ